MEEKKLRIKNILGLAARIAVSFVIIAVIFWKYDELKNIDVRALVDASESFAVAVISILGVYLLKSVTFVVPASIVYIAVGMAFDWWVALMINTVGIALEVIATYFFGRIMGGKKVVEKVEKTKYGEKLLKMQSKNKVSALLAIRFLPVFPIDIVSLLLGAMRTGFGQYMAVSLIGILPRVFLFTILGDGLYKYIPMQKLVIFAVILVPVALAVWVIRYVVKTVKSKKEEE
ncbi:MAG: VTT domain-containing protein [Clostridia bacterium]|nr:VTT domain-containing protein [Clostridia bacterium]